MFKNAEMEPFARKNLRYRILKTEDRYYLLDVERPFFDCLLLTLVDLFCASQIIHAKCRLSIKKMVPYHSNLAERNYLILRTSVLFLSHLLLGEFFF